MFVFFKILNYETTRRDSRGSGDGYTISNENLKEFSFQARKEYYVETED